AQQNPPTWVRLAASGTTVTAAVSGDGTTWTTIGTTSIAFAGSTQVGLVVGSNTSGLNTSTFDNVTVSSAGGGGLPSPWTHQDVGAVDAAGSASYANGVFTVKGAGTI